MTVAKLLYKIWLHPTFRACETRLPYERTFFPAKCSFVKKFSKLQTNQPGSKSQIYNRKHKQQAMTLRRNFAALGALVSIRPDLLIFLASIMSYWQCSFSSCVAILI
ncbi:hypothetical protein SUGI_0550110 [Cryptomeria japonica]|nr:hypothetical protein SUGI_0550110 [Cryptomeria japonica]